MRKIEDYFFAGTIFGIIGGLFADILTLLFISLGIKMRTPWWDMAALFFEPPEANTWLAKLFGFGVSIGVSITNGVIIGFILKKTGKDYAYIKSIVFSLASGYFAFMILYPSLGFKVVQHSIATNYLATLIFVLYGILLAFLFTRYANIKKRPQALEQTVIIVAKERLPLLKRISKYFKRN